MAWIAADRCGTCKFSFKADKMMVCRRNPPVAQAVMRGTPEGPVPIGCVANFPPIQDGQWCGEYVRGVNQAVENAQPNEMVRVQ